MKIHWIPKSAVGTSADLRVATDTAPDGVIGIASADLIPTLSLSNLEDWLSKADVVHAGLLFGGDQAFTTVQLCTFNWHFLNPLPDKAAVSWKATLDFVLFEKNLLRQIGPFEEQYSKPEAALMDWVYRAMVAGAKTIYRPLPVPPARSNQLAMRLNDEMLFVSRHFNTRAQNFYRFCQLFLSGRFLSIPPVSFCCQSADTVNSFKLTSSSSSQQVSSYSALIPTIDRYEYIRKSIDSLIALRFPPSEIVVVDQTPNEKRKPEVYAPYLQAGVLKVIFLDHAGQCTARNRGLAAVTHPWVLLFEDDSVAWPDMVEEHIALIEKSGCDVSTGVIVPPGAGREFIPNSNRKYFLADILTTGNAFMKTSTAKAVGGFDPAFDHGPGADDDFGKRLYMAGKVIVYNFRSIETHYKAPTGGMRVHGIWWRNKGTFFGPYPPATQTFTILKYYPRRFHPFLFLNMILKARKKYSVGAYIVFVLFLPYKLFLSVAKARKLSKET